MKTTSGKLEIRQRLICGGLKVTPQRMAILEAIVHLNNHPTAEMIIEHIQAEHPNIAVGTVYKALEKFIDKGIIVKVFTENDISRYDAVKTKHHHLYYSDSQKIEDYHDAELSGLVEDYFNTHEIPEFNIEEVKIQIIGRRNKN